MSEPTRADLGGQPGHGAVRPEPETQRFHADWEPCALALTLAMGATGAWNLDTSRAARETLPDYARLGYYEIWIYALQKLLVAHGLATAEEIAAGHARQPGRPLPRCLQAADVAGALARGAPTLRAATTPARFTVGDRVRTRAEPVAHHTRLPGYARGRLGTIERVHGVHVFADAHAQGLGEQPQWLYAVAFDAAELWGPAAASGASVCLDAWEPYLAPARAPR